MHGFCTSLDKPFAGKDLKVEGQVSYFLNRIYSSPQLYL